MKSYLLSTLAIAISPTATAGLDLPDIKLLNPVNLVKKTLIHKTPPQIEMLNDLGLATNNHILNVPIGKRFSNFVQGGSLQRTTNNVDVLLRFLRGGDEFAARFDAYLDNNEEEEPINKTHPIKPNRPENIRSLFAYGITNVIKLDPFFSKRQASLNLDYGCF